MFAVFESGGKQYKVKKDDILKIEKIDCKKGQSIKIEKILLLKNDKEETIIGTPYIKEVFISAKVIDVIKDEKVLIFKKKRRHNYRRKLGHRQNVVILKIEKINVSSKSSKSEISKNTNEDSKNDDKSTFVKEEKTQNKDK
ncbi:MAG: 50S ribosomal protein L21 [Rickettsiales bacterium]|nr:50S ribosomal protein L21 [Rickettsiales bacterium]|tara:strand:+ start:61 stop:483 length:423 start_codon:yes stop_codon:yes gene_type:complete